MVAIVTAYSDAVYNNLRPLHANWEPTQPIALGDYGILAGHVFQRLGDVSQLGIAIGNQIVDSVGDQKVFASGQDTTVSFRASGSVPAGAAANAKAGVDINFGSQGSVFFNAAGCSYSLIADKSALGRAILQAYDENKWDRSWAVVTDMVKAKSTTVAVAGGANAKLALDASGAVSQIDLANASLSLQLSTSSNVGYQVIAKADLVPLIGISKIQTRFFGWSPKFKPLTTGVLGNQDIVDRLLSSRGVETESREDLYFGQVF